MDRPRIAVDFNEMPDRNLVLLSKFDTCTDSSGEQIALHPGLRVFVFMEDLDADGRPDHLVADGVAERNTETSGWTAAAKWCCRIDEQGVRHESNVTRG